MYMRFIVRPLKCLYGYELFYTINGEYGKSYCVVV